MNQASERIDSRIEEAIQRALVLNRHKQTAAAIEIMTGLARECPTARSVQGCLALFLHRAGRFTEAVEHAQLAVQQSPASATASMMLYSSLGKAEMYGEALEEMKRHLSLRTTNEDADVLRDLLAELVRENDANPGSRR